MSTSLALTLLAGVSAAGLITLHFLLLVFTPFPHPPTAREKTYTTTPNSEPAKLPSLSDEPTLGLSVVIPAYNETERLPIMLDEAMEHLLAVSKRKQAKANGTTREEAVVNVVRDGVELLVVDDGSTDGTTETARKLAEKWKKAAGLEGRKVEIRAIRLEENRGKGGAVQHGVCHSRGRLILFADADGASKFADLDLLLQAMETTADKDDHGVVIGSRAHLVKTEAVVKRSKLRNLLMHGFHLFLRTLGVRGIRDTQCGFKLFTRQTARLLFPSLHLPRWSFDVELLLLASLCKPPIPIKEVSIRWQEISGSKIRLGWDSIGMARDLLVLRANLALGRWSVPNREEQPKK